MSGISSPTLVVDERKCRLNIERMGTKAKKSNALFRPHFKTHQSIDVGRWVQEFGIDGISVSSIDMARYFAAGGFDDITVCVPFNPREIDKANRLAANIRLNCLVDSQRVAAYLADRVTAPLGMFIEVDCGYRRTGVPSDDETTMNRIIVAMRENSNIRFMGFLTHAGHSYHTESVQEIIEIHEDTKKKMHAISDHFKRDHPGLLLSFGDTPCCSVIPDFDGMDEARPGNFVFYDMTQVALGACGPAEVAVALACGVIGKYEARGELVVHGGGVHLGKESLIDRDGRVSFGHVVELSDSGWNDPVPGAVVTSLSQEHGVISAPREFLARTQIGDIIGILPVHACITADTAGKYVTADSKPLNHRRTLAV